MWNLDDSPYRKKTKAIDEPRDEADVALMQEAEARNFLWLEGPQEEQNRLDIIWMRWCRERRLPCIVATLDGDFARVLFKPRPGQTLTEIGEERVRTIFRDYEPGITEERDWRPGNLVVATRVEEVVARLQEECETDAQPERLQEVAARYPLGLEGMAVCIDNEGIEHDMEIGDSVYVREIPNMRGHCVVLRDGQPPLVGWHLSRFRLQS
ncbi:MAG TPA: hypothetical protein VGO93_31200 [Candidatus Xenobia bacterium]|jgi:hypothetical protein